MSTAQAEECCKKLYVHIFEVVVVVVFLHGDYCTDYNFKFMLYTEQSLYGGDPVVKVPKFATKVILSYTVKL